MKNSENSKNRILVVLLAIVAVGAGIWAAVNFSKTPAFSETRLFEVQKGSVESEASVDIALAASSDTDLSFENSGKIKNIFVSVGDRVAKGQLLAEIENSDYVVALRGAIASRDASAAQLKQAEEDVDVQKAKLQSLKNADAKKYDVKAQKETKEKSLAGVESYQALLRAAEDQVTAANLQLAKTRLTAPANGTITDKFAEIGEVVAQANPVMKLAAEGALEADAFVSELEVKQFVIGNEAEIEISSAGENPIVFSAKIKNIYPAAVEKDGASSYKIVFDLSEQSSDLKAGMTGVAKIKLSQQTGVISIPQSSLFSDGAKKYVMVLSAGFPQRKEVQVGALGTDGTAEILSGLSVGDKIIKF